MTELTSEAIADMTRAFTRSGGKVRRIRRGVTASRPSTLPRDLRDQYIEKIQTRGLASTRYILTLKQVYAVEEMIARRAGLDAIAARIGMTGKPLAKIVARLESSGVAFPDYLRKDVALLIEDGRENPKTEDTVSHKKMPRQPKPGKEIRPLTSAELQAFEMVRCGYNTNVAARAYGLRAQALRQLIVTRFGGPYDLMKVKNFAALQRALEVKNNDSEGAAEPVVRCLNCGAAMPDDWRGGRCDPCAGRAPLRGAQ